MNNTYTDTKLTDKNELYAQYNWLSSTFSPKIQESSDNFFSELFDYKLVSVSKNQNILFKGEDYFVTKVRFNKQNEVFLRISETGVKSILNKVLGPSEKAFSMTALTELEAKIITAFNEHAYKNISQFFSPQNSNQSHDITHLTFFFKSKDGSDFGKYIISIPQTLLTPQEAQNLQENFNVSDFSKSLVKVKIKVGTTKFYVKELKNLEKEDLVIFEDSNIQQMELIYKDYKQNFRVTPNPGLITSLENINGGHNMNENALSQELWDNIQVEMDAIFDSVKITLGELKSIEQGLVVDISSVYDNKILLKVEDKTIAKGELVIINDRYGVKIDEVFATQKAQAQQEISQTNAEVITEQGATEAQVHEQEGAEEEFDYSDFELDEQDV
ncbi:MAG TPA: FliM/FliN family flagellar motor switch protein [Candidatus Gastranaerophilaceae bacterium]|nr:FliM/FliN family flagellar motor switch protein [Candidatus Gastranaerophilaceae bacterium]HPT41721.1 FliM/FliN family flagellar motor switch protein [Candidatus Gastranaerophilaceae bacterium]